MAVMSSLSPRPISTGTKKGASRPWMRYVIGSSSSNEQARYTSDRMRTSSFRLLVASIWSRFVARSTNFTAVHVSQLRFVPNYGSCHRARDAGPDSGQICPTRPTLESRRLEPLLQLDDGILLDPQLAEQSKRDRGLEGNERHPVMPRHPLEATGPVRRWVVRDVVARSMQLAAQTAPEPLKGSRRYFIRKEAGDCRHLGSEAFTAVYGDCSERRDQP